MQLLLSAYSQTEDVIVAAIVNNRKRPELADVIGPFANNVALRTNLSGQPLLLASALHDHNHCAWSHVPGSPQT